MNLIRLLLVIAIVWLVVTLVRQYLARRRPAAVQQREAEQMVRCSRCGVYLPQGQAHRAGSDYLCDEHRR